MSKFKLEFKLKQHTPLIHFQHDQHGATLRATELKPKLDRFIINEKGGKDKIPYDWLIDKEKESLDYKVKVSCGNLIDLKMKEEIKKGKWSTSFPTFFGNTGIETQESLKNFTKYDRVNVEICSFNTKLLNEIDDCFPSFIGCTNFGTRQSKGFGSFFLDLEYHDNIRLDDIFGNIPSLKISDKKNRDIFNVINYYYQRLKSGVNFSPKNNKFCHHEHSFLKQYISNVHIPYKWEKRWLKEKFIGLSPNSDEKRFARSMLGLVGSYTFINKNNPCNNISAGNVHNFV